MVQLFANRRQLDGTERMAGDMTDIEKRLRAEIAPTHTLCVEAADEIKRLRELLDRQPAMKTDKEKLKVLDTFVVEEVVGMTDKEVFVLIDKNEVEKAIQAKENALRGVRIKTYK